MLLRNVEAQVHTVFSFPFFWVSKLLVVAALACIESLSVVTYLSCLFLVFFVFLFEVNEGAGWTFGDQPHRTVSITKSSLC